MLIDTHVHLNSPQFENDLDDVLQNAREAGVQQFLVPGYDLESSQMAVQMAQQETSIVAAVGVHPHDARLYTDELERQLDTWLSSGQAQAAGEMGLDYHYDNSPRSVQRQVFIRQLHLAHTHNVPAVIHSRESDADMIEILTREASTLRLVLHAFTGSRPLLEMGLKMDSYFGIGGFLTFKKHELIETILEIPLDRMLLETDAPYLSPAPYRGKRNEPARIPVIARRLSEIRQIDLAEIAARTTANYQRFLTPLARQ